MRSPAVAVKVHDVKVTLEDLAGVHGAIGERAALIAGGDGDRPRRVGHRQAIGARAVNAAVGTRDQDQIGAGDRGNGVVDHGRAHVPGVAEGAAGRSSTAESTA